MKFKELRVKLNDTQNKLDKTNNIVCIQINEIESLNQLIELQSKQIKSMKQEKIVEAKVKNRLKIKLRITQRSRDLFYKRWLLENKKNGNQRIMLYLSSIATVIFAIMFTIGISKC